MQQSAPVVTACAAGHLRLQPLAPTHRLRRPPQSPSLGSLGRQPMREIIQRHNRLNGVIFSIFEFAVIALFIGAFATYYLLHDQAVMAIIAWGITLNCVPVVVCGLCQLAQDRASGKRIGSFWDRKARDQHRQENPHMLRVH